MAGLLRAWMTEYLDTHDDPVLQLTGGHDSRILLGAIPRSRRNGLRTLTLDAPGGVDAPIGDSGNPDAGRDKQRAAFGATLQELRRRVAARPDSRLRTGRRRC